MVKPIIGYGLAGGRQFVTKIDDKWKFDEAAFTEYVRQIADAGCDVWRDLPWSVWGVKSIDDVFCAFGITDGKFDLTKWNEEWWAITRRKIEILNKYGIKFILELTCANELSGAEAAFSPWMVNVQEIKTFYVPAADVYLKAFIEKCIAEFAGLDIAYGQGNECHDYRMVRVCKDVINKTLKEHGLMPWSYADHFKPFYPFKYFAPAMKVVKRLGLDGNDLMEDCRFVRNDPALFDTLTAAEKEAIVGVANGSTASPLDDMKEDVGRMFGERAQFEVFYPAHSCGNADDEQVFFMLRYYGGNRDVNFYLSDDGVKDGKDLEDRNASGSYIRPSDTEWDGMIAKVLMNKKQGEVWFEHTPERADLIDCQVRKIKAMSQAIYNLTGEYPPNYGKHPKPVEPPMPSTPEPVKPPFNFIGWLSNNRGYIAATILLSLIIMAFAC